MNIKNNSRYKISSEKIETAFLSLLTKYKYEDISISKICEIAGINRSTFYCHYDDINDLTIKIESKFAKSTASIFNFGERQTHEAMVEMFAFIKENKSFYKAFLNIPYTTFAETDTKIKCLEHVSKSSNIKSSIDMGLFYRGSFFGAGIKEMCRIWLERECKETPEEMATLLTKLVNPETLKNACIEDTVE